MADVRFLGKPDIVGIGKTAPPASVEEWKRVALLAYLCLNLPLRLHTDTALAALLWPEIGSTLGCRRVEKAVRWLNSFSSETIVDATRFGEYKALQTAFSVDVWAFRGGVRMKRYEDALTLYGGLLMDGVEFTDAPDFMEWLGRQRTRYARLASLCAWRSYERALENGDRSLASGLLVLAYERSPVPKPAIARVMALLAEAGAPDEALRLFERDPDPSEEAKRLAVRLDPTAGPLPQPKRTGLVAGVAGLAVLVAVAVLALPDREGEPPPAAEPSAEQRETANAPGPTGGAPPNSALIWELANRHMGARDYRQAETLFKLLTADPELGESATAGAFLASIYETIPAENPVQLYDLVQQAPNDVFHMTEGPLDKAQFLGWIVAPQDTLLAQQHFQDAKAAAEARIAERDDDPWSYRNLALAELGLNDREQALIALDRAEALAGQAGTGHLRSKLLEARTMVAGVETEEGQTWLNILRSPDNPWYPDSTQIATDPRWR
ncbi:MAG: AfsR/SARP family transcriptional regulator [Longimicrobiales bacterium]